MNQETWGNPPGDDTIMTPIKKTVDLLTQKI
jgi:hypothetical protein